MRHEKITLVALAYIIGFTTAFIAFGLPKPAHSPNQIKQTPVVQQASVISAVKIEEREDGLYVVGNGKDRILSATTQGADAIKEGFHSKIVTAQVSPNGDLIHYCSQSTEDENYCLNYVYDMASDTVHRVKSADGKHVASLNTANGDSWIADRILSIEGMKSSHEDTPWMLQ